jgi:hypothetical protein
MATATLTNLLTVHSDCDTNTGWTGITTLDSEVVKQGNSSVSGISRTAGANLRYYTTNVNLSNSHIRIWINFASIGFLNTMAAGGICLYVLGGGVAGYWYVGGVDTYEGGWGLFTVDTAKTPDSGTPNLSSVTRIGFELRLTGAPRNATNTWVDYLSSGNIGYSVVGGTSIDPVRLEDVYLADLGRGVTRKVSGVYYFTSAIQFGATSGTTNCYFNILNQIVVFEDAPVNANLYSITFASASTNTTAINISGSVIKSANTATRFDLAATDANLNSFSLDSSTLANGDAISFKAGQSITNNVFQNCNTITPSTATFTGNTVSNSTTATGCLVLPTTGMGVSDCTFIGNTAAIRITAAGDYIFTNMNFSGNTTDVYVTATTGTVNITVSGTGNCSTYISAGATVNIITGTRKFKLTGIVAGSEVRVFRSSDQYEYYGSESSTGTDEFTYTYTTDIPVYVMIVNNAYEHLRINATLVNADTTIPVQQRIDRWYLNPV